MLKFFLQIGHNEFKLPLSARGIFLDRHRPLFLCEYLLADKDGEDIRAQNSLSMSVSLSHHSLSLSASPHNVVFGNQFKPRQATIIEAEKDESLLEASRHRVQGILESDKDGSLVHSKKKFKASLKPDKDGPLLQGMKKAKTAAPRKKMSIKRSSAALLGEYKSLEKEHLSSHGLGDVSGNGLDDFSGHGFDDSSRHNLKSLSSHSLSFLGESSHNLSHLSTVHDERQAGNEHHPTLKKILDKAIQEKKWQTRAHRLFEKFKTKNGKLQHNDFITGMQAIDCGVSVDELSKLFLRL